MQNPLDIVIAKEDDEEVDRWLTQFPENDVRTYITQRNKLRELIAWGEGFPETRLHIVKEVVRALATRTDLSDHLGIILYERRRN